MATNITTSSVLDCYAMNGNQNPDTRENIMSNFPSITIAGRRIASDEMPYVIAEMSANHNGNIETAFKLIEAAKQAGADAVKLQTYRPDTITLNCDTEDFRIRGGLWDGRTLYELYEEAHMPWDWHAPLFAHARKHGITIFSSPFDNTAVDLLEDLNAPAYKIASFEAVDIPLIKYVASTGKPMIISTGMADAEEIGEAIDAAREGGCKELAILHCVSGYPAPAEDYNLHTITDMIRRFGLTVGLSDHTLDNTTAIASVATGAAIIEKHFTLDRNGGGPDDSFSLEPVELTALCNGSRTAWAALGRVDYGRKSSEQGNVKFRRSLYFVRDLKAGETVSADCMRSVRPGFGASPRMFEKIVGLKLNCDVQKNTPVKMDFFDLPAMSIIYEDKLP
jgi:pseudaminic acid synthase